MRSPFVTRAVAIFAGATAFAAAQAPQTTFRAGVELVQLDVSVQDSKRQPVRGLTASDFTVSHVRELVGSAPSAGSAAGHLLELPIATLALGEYLLTIDVESAGRTAQRTSRFRVE